MIIAKTTAQNYDIQKVTVADLEQKTHPKDPSAEAAFLYSIGKTYFIYEQGVGFKLVTHVRNRIKIYKKEGYEWANQTVAYYDANGPTREKVTFDNGVTYNLEGGKIEKTKLKSDAVFNTKENKYWSTKKIAMPNVKQGSVIEYEYTITSPNIFSFPEWIFQHSIPVDYSEFKTVIPEYFTYSHLQRGAQLLNIKNSSSRSSVHIVEKQEAEGVAVKAYRDEYDVNFTENISVYAAHDLKAVKEEKYMNSARNYRCSLEHELMMTQYPHSATKTYSSSWEDVAKTVQRSDDFGAELAKTGYFEDAVSALIAPLKTPDEKVGAILSYVKSNVKWNGRKSYACEQGVKAAFKQKTGNAAEINLMLTAMLRYAGLDANPVLVSTRSHGISLFPAVGSYDYVVSGLKIADETFLLDATEAFSAPNVLPLRDLNWSGLMIDKNAGVSHVPLVPTNLSAANYTMLCKIAADGNVSGQVRRQLSDNFALEFRSANAGKKSEIYLEELENENRSIEISGYKRENETDCSKPLVESYSFSKNSAVEIIGDKMYVTPMLFLSESENPFNLDEREYPVDFGFPKRTKTMVMVEIPEGYAVETLPAPTNLAMADDLGSFKYSVTNANGKVQLMVNAEFAKAVIPAEAYPMLRDFYQKMVDKQNEKIVLKKI